MKDAWRSSVGFWVAGFLMLLSALPVETPSQSEGKSTACKKEVFAALKPLPKLRYRCLPEGASDYDERILKTPGRARALTAYLRMLEQLSAHAWWQARVADLNVCYFSGRPGALTPEEQEKFDVGDYTIGLLGEGRTRLVITRDPCYQTGFGGSNAFLLYRTGRGVRATQVLDGFFSRADNPIGLDFAANGAEEIVEVATSTGGLNPYSTSYYFVIDKSSGRAVPKKLFDEGGVLTNKLTSAMVLTLPEEEGELRVVQGRRLAESFYVYGENPDGEIDDGGRRLSKSVFKWNGRIYTVAKSGN